MDIKVNAQEWKGLDEEDRAKIQSIIGAHFKDAKVAGDHKSEPAMKVLAQPRMTSFNFKNPFGSSACGIAEAAAVAACAALSGPLVPICVAAAHAAGNLCRSKS
jgi:hypothetical protein